MIGVTAGLVAPRYGIHSLRGALGVSAISVCACAFGFFVLGAEGLICIVMAVPLALVLAAAGAASVSFSHTAHKVSGSSANGSSLLLAPALVACNLFFSQQEPAHSVTTELEIAAAPERVWENVIHFRDLPEPTELLFRVGLAYPKRAEIVGTGVGAVRYCEFSTGPFVEPIEVWDEPRLLRFSVAHNPEPLREVSVYKSIHPSHLNGYFASEKGQFKLTALANGHTLLSGTTWYRLNMQPSPYWRLWSDAIVHQIHFRVLRHIQNLSQGNG